MRLVQLYGGGGTAFLLLGKRFLDFGDALLVVGNLLVQLVDAVHGLVVFGRCTLDLLLRGICLHVDVDILGPGSLPRKARCRHATKCQRCA